MIKQSKQARTFSELIEMAEQKGLIIDDKAHAKKFLSRFNYYNFADYLSQFKDENGNYPSNLTFEEVEKTFEFDGRLKNILMYCLEKIERLIKSHISYYLSNKIGTYGYLEAKHYIYPREYQAFLRKLKRSIDQNKHFPYVAHHIKNYQSKFPIWVAVELFSFGTIHGLYKNLLYHHQVAIAEDFSITPELFNDWINRIRHLRNLVAHYMRIYNVDFYKTPIISDRHPKNYTPSNKVFDIILVMRYMYIDDDLFIDEIVEDIEYLIHLFDGYIELDKIGFPDNWKELLTK